MHIMIITCMCVINDLNIIHYTQRTRWRTSTEDVCHWLIHEKLQESGLSFHPQDGDPWSKCRRPAASACYYFVQYVHHSHFPLLGSLGDADATLAEMKRLKNAGGPGVTNAMRTMTLPIAQLYIDDVMPDAYEIQAARRAATTATTPNNVPDPSAVSSSTPPQRPAVRTSVDVTPTVVAPAAVATVTEDVPNTESQPRRRTNRPRRSSRRQNNSWPVGTPVAKDFGKVYVGSVVSIKPATESDQQLWHILYEDDDEEDFDEDQMLEAVALYVTHDSDDDSSDSDVFDPLV